MLNQLGLSTGGPPNSVTIGGRQFRFMATEGVDAAAASGAGRSNADLVNGAINSAMQSLTMQLLPQQHRLLALPPQVQASESAALLEAANQQQQLQQGGGAAAPDTANIRGQASNVSMLSRLVTRMNETAAPNSYAYPRDGRSTLISARHPGTGGLINVAINPASLLSPGMGAGASLWQTLEALGQPGGLLAGGPGGNMGLGDVNDSVWDEAVNQLLEVLAPNGVGRNQRLPGGLPPPVPVGRAGAAGAVDIAGLDPRECRTDTN